MLDLYLPIIIVIVENDLACIKSLLNYTSPSSLTRHKDCHGLTFVDHAKLSGRKDVLRATRIKLADYQSAKTSQHCAS